MKPMFNVIAWVATALIVIALWPFFDEDDGLGRSTKL